MTERPMARRLESWRIGFFAAMLCDLAYSIASGVVFLFPKTNSDWITMLQRRWIAPFAFLCLGILGCGGSERELPVTVTVTGTVTLDGKPLSETEILFEGEGQGAWAEVKNGKYTLQSTLGKRTVMFSKRVPAGEADETGAVPQKEVIPAKYNSESKLSANVIQSGPNTFDFEL